MKSDLSWPWFLFHIFQTCIFQFYAAPRLSSLGMTLIKKRNQKVANEIGVSGAYLHEPRWDYSIGAISIACLAIGFFFNEMIFYRVGQNLSIIGFLLTCLFYDCWRISILKKLLPPPDVRRATLEPRKVGRTVPVWAWGIFLAFSIFFYILNNKIITEILIRSFVVVVMVSSAWFVEKRRPITDNQQDDLAYRTSEAWTVYAVAWTLPIIGFLKDNLTSNMAEAVLSTAPLICFIVFLNSPIYKRLKS